MLVGSQNHLLESFFKYKILKFGGCLKICNFSMIPKIRKMLILELWPIFRGFSPTHQTIPPPPTPRPRRWILGERCKGRGSKKRKGRRVGQYLRSYSEFLAPLLQGNDIPDGHTQANSIRRGVPCLLLSVRPSVCRTIVLHDVNLGLISPLMAPSCIACQSPTISSPISGVVRRSTSQLPSPPSQFVINQYGRLM